MFKKIMSVMLAVFVLMSVVAISASAAQVEIADNSAEAIADVAADGSAETGAANVLNFDTTTSGWNNYKKVFCHVWVYGGESFYSWQSKAEACTDKDGDGIWTYDLDAKNVPLEANTLYAVIFSNENGMQTYNLLFDTNVLGDTAYCDGTMYENPEDSSKTAQAAFWRGQDAATYGPEMCITSIGNVVGTCMPYTTSKMAMFEDFLVNKLENARLYAEKDDQQLLDDTAAAIGLGQDDIEKAIANTGVSVDWTKAESAAPEGTTPGADEKPQNPGSPAPTPGNNGDENADEKSDDKSDNKTDNKTDNKSNGGSSNGGSSNGGSSSGRSGSGSSTQTGPETTAILVMFGVMIAAAGVVVIARRRENA